MQKDFHTGARRHSCSTCDRCRIDISHGFLPNRSCSVADYRQLASTYDASCRRIEYIRTAAVNALALQPGQTVFDIACGTGATLLELSRRVGPHGKVVGINHSPEMAAIAWQRIAGNCQRKTGRLVVGFPAEWLDPLAWKALSNHGAKHFTPLGAPEGILPGYPGYGNF